MRTLCRSRKTLIAWPARIGQAVEIERPLPEWLIVPILLALGASAVLIAVIGSMLVPCTPHLPSASPSFAPTSKKAKIETETRQDVPPLSPSDSWQSEEDDGGLPITAPKLRRQLASVLPLDRAESLPIQTNVSPPARLIESNLRSPIRWTVESTPAGTIGLMMPIEVAKIDDGPIPHVLRRLQFPDDAAVRLRLGVTPCVHDDLGRVLTTMGDGYRYSSMKREDLASVAALQKHDVVFLTCADLYQQDFRAVLPLRKFVEQGGTLYASDLCSDLVAAAFPEYRAKNPPLPGVPQNVETIVVEKALQAHLGRTTIPLHFDAPNWRPATFDSAKVTVCLRGIYRNQLGQTRSAPLLVKFRHQKGTVIFTSFHHTKNDSQVVRKVLDYLVFASVNARSEARVKDLMQRSGFGVDDLRALALTPGQPTEVVQPHVAGSLQVALGFEHAGAKLKMTLCSPSGHIVEHSDDGLYVIEVPAAEPGLWRCTITPQVLPHPNFPIVLAAGVPKS